MENNTMNNPNDKNKNSKTLLYAIIGVLLALNGGLFYMWQKGGNEKDKLSSTLVSTTKDLKEKNEALAEAEHLLEKFRVDSAVLAGKNKDMDEQLIRKKNEIMALVTKLRKSQTASAEEIAELKEKIAEMTKEMAILQEKNKELVAVNAKLDEDNSRLKSEVTDISTKNSELTVEKNKFKSAAQRLRTQGVKVETLKKRWITGKEAVTSKAKDVESFRTSFTIADNDIAEAGERTIYVKITGPEGITLTNPGNEGGTFEFENNESKYTYKLQTIFDQEAKNVAPTLWKPAANLKAGKYTVELYSEGYKMGAASFSLK